MFKQTNKHFFSLFSVSGAQIKSLVIACNLKKGRKYGTLKCHRNKKFREKDPSLKATYIQLQDNTFEGCEKFMK